MARARGNGRPGDGHISRITRLELENWRNFRRVDIQTEGRVFLVGPNASGKSNLLDVNRFLRDIVAVGGGFRAAVERRGGVSCRRLGREVSSSSPSSPAEGEALLLDGYSRVSPRTSSVANGE